MNKNAQCSFIANVNKVTEKLAEIIKANKTFTPDVLEDIKIITDNLEDIISWASLMEDGFNFPVVPTVGDEKYKIYHQGNDGAGSGLDADKLDGHDSSYFASKEDLNSIDFCGKLNTCLDDVNINNKLNGIIANYLSTHGGGSTSGGGGSSGGGSTVTNPTISKIGFGQNSLTHIPSNVEDTQPISLEVTFDKLTPDGTYSIKGIIGGIEKTVNIPSGSSAYAVDFTAKQIRDGKPTAEVIVYKDGVEIERKTLSYTADEFINVGNGLVQDMYFGLPNAKTTHFINDGSLFPILNIEMDESLLTSPNVYFATTIVNHTYIKGFVDKNPSSSINCSLEINAKHWIDDISKKVTVVVYKTEDNGNAVEVDRKDFIYTTEDTASPMGSLVGADEVIYHTNVDTTGVNKNYDISADVLTYFIPSPTRDKIRFDFNIDSSVTLPVTVNFTQVLETPFIAEHLQNPFPALGEIGIVCSGTISSVSEHLYPVKFIIDSREASMVIPKSLFSAYNPGNNPFTGDVSFTASDDINLTVKGFN